MQKLMTDIAVQVARSYQQLARILDAERHLAVRMSEMIRSLPDANPEFEGQDDLIENASRINKSVIGYLNSLADLEESAAESLRLIASTAEEAEAEE